jgi:hypothetical protein
MLKYTVRSFMIMTRPLDLPEPIYDALVQAASTSGTTPVGWIAAHLPPVAPAAATNGARTLADLFAGHVGRVASGGSNCSEDGSRIFADDLEQKRREDRL